MVRRTSARAGEGAIFSVTPQGSETLLHRFAGADGAQPVGAPIAIDGVLYGTTYYGGANNVGVAYALDLSGHYTILHSFAGGKHDGAQPYGGLVLLGGTLYGTTAAGGRFDRGTVYAMTPSGAERVLHSFHSVDGQTPSSSLTVLGGRLYGTTTLGGTYGLGTIFETQTSGKTTVVHSFGSGKDGSQPLAAPLAVDGTL